MASTFGTLTFGSGTFGDFTAIVKTGTGDAGSSAEAVIERTLEGTDARSVVDNAGTQSTVAPTDKAGSDTGTGTEAQTRYLPGEFSTIPVPRTWVNGDSLSEGILNQQWRDTFRFLLGYTRPAFSGYYLNTGYTYTSGTPIPLVTESLKRGNIAHAASDTKVYVWEDGWYDGTILISGDASGILTGGTFLTSSVMVNGAVVSTRDNSRKLSGRAAVGHFFSLDLEAGDYIEIAVTGTWTGTYGQSPGSELAQVPRLEMFWRTN